MARFSNFDPAGVIPACILPFHDDLSLDLKSFKKHVLDVAAVHGLAALTVNAHSTEVGSCTVDEQHQIMQAAGEAVGDKLPIVHGIYAEGSLEAARLARQAEAGGASALLVFPPGPFTLGQRPEMVIAHFKH
ncbi:MAG TPA: dihydrodipicolinate synthase family protein, partial [Bradyrhizobium sp.]|nr:dihydrodipicolinate synthase family protein [Bradyrhizobium sp.]